MEYDNVATALQQSATLPTFEYAKSTLDLKESRKARQAANANLTAATNPPPPNPPPSPAPGGSDSHSHQQHFYQGCGSESHERGRGGRRGGRGRSRGRGNNGFSNFGTFGNPPQWQQWQVPSQAPWPVPPCPYPTFPLTRPSTRNLGILGPAPSTSYVSANDYSYMPTNIDYAFQAMSLNPDQTWYMDSAATNHMANNSGLQDQTSPF